MPSASSKLSAPRKLLYSTGNLGGGGYTQLLSAFLLFFLVDVIYLDPWLASVIFAISYGVWNGINDPIIGSLSDRTRTRWGRRKPWIAIGAPLCLLFSIFIWSPPLGGHPLTNPHDLWMFFYMLAIIAAAELTFTMTAVPYLSLYPEMFTSVKERSEVVVYRQIFGIVGAILAMVAFPLLVTAFSGGAQLEITTTSLPDGMIDVPYSENLQATGGTPPYTWENIGSLPDNLDLDSDNGTIFGTPTAADNFTFTVRVTDNASNTDTLELGIRVRAAGEFGITTENLLDGRVAMDYCEELQAIMKEGPYTWSLENGVLPDGLSLSTDGVISGTPTTEGTFDFIVMVTDNTENTDTNELSIHIDVQLLVSGTLRGWAWAGGIIVAVFMGSYLIGGVLGGKERKEFTVVDKPLGFFESLKTAVTNRSLLSYEGAHVMSWCMFGWLSAMMPFFVTHVLKAELSAISVVLGVNMLGIFAFIAVWRKICIRYGARKTLAVSMVTFTLSLALALVVRNVLEAAVMGFLAGATIGGTVLSREVIFCDIIDEDEVKSGVKREGALIGVIVALEKLSLVVIAACTAILLSTIIGYVPGQASPSFMGMGIRLGMFGFTAIFLVIALVSLKFYPLTKKKTDEIAKELKKLHAEKAKKLKLMTKKKRTTK